MLKEQEAHLQGKVRFIFQPAEESNQGARALIAEGVLDGVDAIIGFHNKPEIPVGTIGVKEGPLMAAVGQFKAEITGGRNTCGSTAQRERSNRDGMPSDCQCPSHRCSSYFSARTSGIKRIAYRSREYMEVIPEKVFLKERFVPLIKSGT